MNKENVLFLHIPKTAGTTIQTGFIDIAEKNKNIIFTKAAVAGLNDHFSFDHFKHINLNQDFHILKGHFVFSESCKKFKLFTMVRDVLDLFISNLYYFYFEYLRTNVNFENINHIKKNITLQLDQSVDDCLIISSLLKNNFVNSNIITKTIAGIPFEKFYFVKEDYKIMEEDYLQAIENLKYFSYIGNTENVNKFLNIFLKSIPINTFEIRHKRIFKKDPKLINTIKNVLGDQINEYNYFDNKILDCIKNRFT